MDEKFISSLQQKHSNTSQSVNDKNSGPRFFKGSVELNDVADTYLDMHNFKKGVVWVNGHNLGRYWNIGPQYRLYCPAPWLKKGMNEVIVFDLHQKMPAEISRKKTLE